MAGLLQMEFTVLDFIKEHFRSPFMDHLASDVTRLGDRGLFWIGLGTSFLFTQKQRKTGVKVLYALGLSAFTCNVLLKKMTTRIRPCDRNQAVKLLIDRPLDFSFPSGHTAASFAAATVLMKSGWKGRHSALTLAFLIAFSRLYLYVHFPTDVLLGALLGTLMGQVSVKSFPFLETSLLRERG